MSVPIVPFALTLLLLGPVALGPALAAPLPDVDPAIDLVDTNTDPLAPTAVSAAENVTGLPGRAAMENTTLLLRQLNESYILIGRELAALDPFNATRNGALGTVKAEFETHNATLDGLRLAALSLAGQDALDPAVDAEAARVLGLAFGTLDTIANLTGPVPGTLRGQLNATFGAANSTAGSQKAAAGATINATRDGTLLPTLLAVIGLAESTRVSVLSQARALDATPTGVAAVVVGQAGAAFGTASSLKNQTANSTLANTTTQTPFMAAYTALRQANATFALANTTLVEPGLAANRTARQIAAENASALVETVNVTLLQAALDAVEADPAGPLHTARSDQIGALRRVLGDLNGTVNGLIVTVAGGRNATAGTVGGSNATVGGANADANATRDDVTGPELDAILGRANATRALVSSEILALAAQVGPQLLENVPSIPQTLGANGVPVLHILSPSSGGHNRSSPAAPLRIQFTTNLPMPGGGPGFEAAYSRMGSGEWTYMERTACTGTAGQTRTCVINYTDPTLNGRVILRVGTPNATVCATGQCGSVANVVIDNTAPSTLLHDTTEPPFIRSGATFPVSFVTEPQATVSLLYRRDGGALTPYDTEVANATGIATFQFTPPGGIAGTYRLYANATDLAGNVETNTSVKITLRAIDSLAVDVGSEALNWVNGETPVVEACVSRGTQDVDDTMGASVTLQVGADAPVPMAHVEGCLWSATLADVSGVTGRTTTPVRVAATIPADAISGEAVDALTYSEHPLVVLSLDTAGEILEDNRLVPVGSSANFAVKAIYNKTGEPADLVRIVATGGGAPVEAISFDGGAYFDLASPPGVANISLTFSAIEELFGATPVTSLDVQGNVIWSRIVTEEAASDGPVHNADVGGTFNVTYSLEWAHDATPVVGGIVTLVNASDDDDAHWSSDSDGSGDALVRLRSDVLAVKRYEISSYFETPAGAVFLDATGSAFDVNFTRVVATIHTNSTLANVAVPFPFNVTASWQHDGASIAGANLTLLVDDRFMRENVTTNASGGGYGSITFPETFADNISVRLKTAMGRVTLQAEPIPNITVVSTQIAIGPFVIPDRDVHPGEPISVSVGAAYVHNGSTSVTGTMTFTNSTGHSQECPLVSGVASCDLQTAVVNSTTFSVSVATNDGITVVQGSPATPQLNWTRLSVLLGDPSDLLADVGATVRIPVNVSYAHDPAQKAAGTTLEARAGPTLLGSCVTDAAGQCALLVTSGAVSSSTLSITAAANELGITELQSAATTPVITWTKLLVSYTSDDGPFNTLRGANYVATVRYAHNNALVPGALVSLSGFSTGTQSNVTDASGVTRIGGIEIAAGTRDITIHARLVSEGILVNETAGGVPATRSHRWTAIAFQAFTYDPAPSEFHADGGPIYPTNTAVTVCTKVVAADTGVAIAGATVTLRGVSKTSDSAGNVCLPIAASSQVRDVRVTAHGVSATIDGKSITSSVDRRTTLHFVNEA